MQEKKNIRIMGFGLAISTLLMALKFVTYYLTGSGGVLSDALESVINVLAGGFALYSLFYAARPKDRNHPYGHGKIEYLSSGFEGGMILLAGLAMVAKGGWGFFERYEVHRADAGAALSAAAGLVNFFLGSYLVRYGTRHNSLLIVADGRHLITDTVSSIGLVLGLLLIWLTGLDWIDYAVTIVFGVSIIYTGFKLVRESVTNLLDEADEKKLEQLVSLLSMNRQPRWIDIHNLRVLKYGSQLHVDCHMTLPWYLTLEEAHNEVSQVERLVRQNLDQQIEFFIHADPCLPTSCPICTISDCAVRKAPFARRVEWSTHNVLPDQKHGVDAD